MTGTRSLPRWDMSVVFPGLESDAFEQGYQEVVDAIDRLAERFDRESIGAWEHADIDDATVQTFDDVTNELNALLERVQTLGAYLHAFVTTDSRDDIAQARLSAFQPHLARLSQLDTRYVAWIGSLDIEALAARSQVAGEHEFVLTRAKEEARHLMSPAEEALAATLTLSAGTAWAKLQGNVSSQLLVRVAMDSDAEPVELPMSALRNLAFEPDRAMRQRAYDAELATWEGAATPIAAALNSIKGEVITLSTRRGWASPLDASLFDNTIDQETLDAMFEAAREAFPDFRRYLHAKARALGLDRLAWYDLFAPLPDAGTRQWDWDAAEEFIVNRFGAYSRHLGDFAYRAFHERWIDAEPRAGKRDGAFCMPLRGDESRILANFKPAFGGVSTLAHELGHGYHNVHRSSRTMLQRTTPMALAETASIFCETIIRDAGLREAAGNPGEQLAILEASLQGSCQVVVDITSRFLFEQGVFERRRERELSVDEMNGLMIDSQHQTYGDGLNAETLHPYMWAAKPHYYSTGRSYYNYPYMFGLLFGLGLYARYQAEPSGFHDRYDDLLASTGMADAATLANRFGIDIRTPDFWRSSLDIIRRDVDQFESLTSG